MTDQTGLGDVIRQMPLNLSLTERPTLDQWIEPPDSHVAESLVAYLKDIGRTPLYLRGGPATGKTHCALALHHAATSKGVSSLYLAASDLGRFGASVLTQVVDTPLLIIDDLDRLTGEPDWDEALFHLFNRQAGQNGGLVLTGRRKNRQIEVSLPDLNSRLAACKSLTLCVLGDEDKIRVLQGKARRRGFELSAEVAHYLIRRVSRHLPDLIETLYQIDRVMLATRRRLTVPLVRECLAAEQGRDGSLV